MARTRSVRITENVYKVCLVEEPLLPEGFPKVITLCGSSRFREAHEEAQKNLTLQGHIVIPMGMYGHLEGLDMDGSIKKMLDVLHFRKIDLSDAIFVVNAVAPTHKDCGGFAMFFLYEGMRHHCRKCGRHFGIEAVEDLPYIGESTRNEINYATEKGKEIIYLNPPKE